MLRVGRPSEQERAALLAQQRDAEVTYSEVGATFGVLPEGYRHDRYRRSLGTGAAAFAAGREGLRAWAGHEHAGLPRLPARPELREGVTLLQTLPVGPGYVFGACRVVTVVDEPSRFGFAYGTLPLHPEKGEEAFVVRRGSDDEVVLEIVVFSRPRNLLARLGWPLGRQIQVRTTHRFLDGVEQFVVRQLAGRRS